MTNPCVTHTMAIKLNNNEQNKRNDEAGLCCYQQRCGFTFPFAVTAN